MNRVKCIISYDGSEFSGFQVQPKDERFKVKLKKYLNRMHKGEFIRIHGFWANGAGFMREDKFFILILPFRFKEENNGHGH